MSMSVNVRVGGINRLRLRVEWSGGGICVDGDCARHLTRSDHRGPSRSAGSSGGLSHVIGEGGVWGFVLVDVALLPEAQR